MKAPKDRLVYRRVIMAPTPVAAARKLATWLGANPGVTILSMDGHHDDTLMEINVTFDRPTVPPASGAAVPDLSVIADALAEVINSLGLPEMISAIYLEPPDDLPAQQTGA